MSTATKNRRNAVVTPTQNKPVTPDDSTMNQNDYIDLRRLMSRYIAKPSNLSDYDLHDLGLLMSMFAELHTSGNVVGFLGVSEEDAQECEEECDRILRIAEGEEKKRVERERENVLGVWVLAALMLFVTGSLSLAWGYL